jgi:hypothetical protein
MMILSTCGFVLCCGLRTALHHLWRHDRFDVLCKMHEGSTITYFLAERSDVTVTIIYLERSHSRLPSDNFGELRFGEVE